jgi:hypothetical protein
LQKGGLWNHSAYCIQREIEILLGSIVCKIVEDMSSTLLMEFVQCPNLKIEGLWQTLGIINIRVIYKVLQIMGTGP